MATSSSSAKKAARLAQKGKGQRVRFQGGTLFPVALAAVFVLGIALVVYARQSRPAADASAPTINDQRHHSYGFYLCDTWVMLSGDGEGLDVNGRPTNTDYVRTGIHSHDDGLIHWHPFSSASIGRRAQFGVFLDTYGVDLSNDRIEFPEDQRSQLPAAFQEDGVIDEEDDQCEITNADGETETFDAQLSVTRWNNISDTDSGTTFIAGFDSIPLDQDAMVIVVAFAENDAEIEMPPWTEDFAVNVGNDAGQLPADELFQGVEVSEDGDVTIDSIPADEVDIGPEVTETDDETDADADADADDETETDESTDDDSDG